MPQDTNHEYLDTDSSIQGTAINQSINTLRRKSNQMLNGGDAFEENNVNTGNSQAVCRSYILDSLADIYKDTTP